MIPNEVEELKTYVIRPCLAKYIWNDEYVPGVVEEGLGIDDAEMTRSRNDSAGNVEIAYHLTNVAWELSHWQRIIQRNYDVKQTKKIHPTQIPTRTEKEQVSWIRPHCSNAEFRPSAPVSCFHLEEGQTFVEEG